MAHTLRRPLSSIIGICPSSQRCFSRYHPLSGVDRQAQAASIKVSANPERSLRVAAKGVQNIPTDLGLLEKTYIHPLFKSLPSPLTSPNDFLHTQWNRIWFRTRDLFSLFVIKWSSPSEKKGGLRRALKLKSSTVGPTAVALHRQMYTAFAEGDTTYLRGICVDGIYDSFRTRIGNRAKGERMEWELVRYNKGAKVMSDRAARLPIDGAAVRQAVVRVSSRQKLTRWRREKDGQMVQVEGTGGERDVVEYVVVQRLFRDWKEGDWQVWGTTRETALEDVDEWVRQEKAGLE